MVTWKIGLTLGTSAFKIPVRWPISIINSVDKTKFSCDHSPTDAAPHFLELSLSF